MHLGGVHSLRNSHDSRIGRVSLLPEGPVAQPASGVTEVSRCQRDQADPIGHSDTDSTASVSVKVLCSCGGGRDSLPHRSLGGSGRGASGLCDHETKLPQTEAGAVC
jgi:hypothetical protein